jgi:hypothetical protein
MKYKTSKALAIIVMNLVVAAALKAGPPGPEVGEPGSFGHNILYMGAASGFIRLSNACAPAPTPVPPMTANNDQCFVLNPQPAPTDFDAPDICRIMLPKKATRTIIYPTLNFFVNYELKNQTGVPQPNGVFNFFAVVSIESDALLDPSIIDPATGDPANGKLTGVFTYNYRDDQTMDTGARQRHQLTLVRAGNAGINKASLVAQGLSQAVVDNLFNSAMTLRMSVSGRGQLLTDPGTATITPNMRLFGD